MFKFLSYGFGCVFGGALTAILICGILLFLSARQTKYGNLTPIALLSGIVLFCLLFYQLTTMYYAIQLKSTVMNAIEALRIGMSSLDLQSSEESVKQLIDRYPIISNFLDISILREINWNEPIKSLQEIIGSQFNSYIYERLGWSAGFTLVFGAAMFLPDKTGTGRKRKGPRKVTSSTGRHYGEDFY